MLTNAPRRNELSPFNGSGAVVLHFQRRSSARVVESVDRERALWLQRNPSVDEFSFTVVIRSRRAGLPVTIAQDN